MGDVIPIVRHGNFMHAQERVWRATIREKRRKALRKFAESCGDQKFAEFQDKWHWSRGFFNREPVNLFPPDEYHREIAAERLNWHYKTLEDAFRVKWLLENFASFQIRVKG